MCLLFILFRLRECQGEPIFIQMLQRSMDWHPATRDIFKQTIGRQNLMCPKLDVHLHQSQVGLDSNSQLKEHSLPTLAYPLGQLWAMGQLHDWLTIWTCFGLFWVGGGVKNAGLWMKRPVGECSHSMLLIIISMLIINWTTVTNFVGFL